MSCGPSTSSRRAAGWTTPRPEVSEWILNAVACKKIWFNIIIRVQLNRLIFQRSYGVIRERGLEAGGQTLISALKLLYWVSRKEKLWKFKQCRLTNMNWSRAKMRRVYGVSSVRRNVFRPQHRQAQRQANIQSDRGTERRGPHFRRCSSCTRSFC